MAFGQKNEEKRRRKEWIIKWMKAKKQRKIENQPDDYLYKENKREVTFTEFVKLELILFFCSLPIPCDSEYCGRT